MIITQRILHFLRRKFFKRIVRKGIRKAGAIAHRWSDKRTCTYSDKPPQSARLNRLLAPPPIAELRIQNAWILGMAENYVNHRFDLLGSGWICVSYNTTCAGVDGCRYDMTPAVAADENGTWLEERINKSNLAESKRIWELIPKNYVPIDWHLDFKSGYRWQEHKWYRDIRFGHLLGVDIKVPWELARMQHLSHLAFAYGLAQEGAPDIKAPCTYLAEFRSQVLDFIATNPPRFGVNWACTMDVAIRIANWLVAYDLFRGYEAEFDNEFEEIFTRSVYEHGRHIINNLEWAEDVRGNHYLADIAGLLFVAAYLPRTPETDAWLAFAAQELVTEVGLQFTPDGANFEASTSYHRLSAEMAIYCTALICGLPDEKATALQTYDYRLHQIKPALNAAPLPTYTIPGQAHARTPFPAWYFERLEKMAEFAMHVTKPDGHIAQIGDNDSGRFLKLWPCCHSMTVAEAKSRYLNLANYADIHSESTYWIEDHLKHDHLVGAINGLFNRTDFTNFSRNAAPETRLIEQLARIEVASYLAAGEQVEAARCRLSTKEAWQELKGISESLSCKHKNVTEITVSGESLVNGLSFYAYPNFGVFIFSSNRLYLLVRCGPVGLNGLGAHAHNDQLSIELNVDGVDWIADPGTYIYTALPDERNRYRSVSAHFSPGNGKVEPGRLDLHLFRMGGQPEGQCLYFGEEGFVGVHHAYDGMAQYRSVSLAHDRIIINDWTDPSLLHPPHYYLLTHDTIPKCPVTFSPGYGIRHA